MERDKEGFVNNLINVIFLLFFKANLPEGKSKNGKNVKNQQVFLDWNLRDGCKFFLAYLNRKFSFRRVY